MATRASLDIDTGEWSFASQPEPYSIDFEIGFNSAGGPVERFNNLAFGLAVSSPDGELLSRSYPDPGVTYLATDQAYLTTDRVEIAPDTQVTFLVWAENAGVRSEGSIEFVAPRPPQPYPSWTWDGTGWQPPVPIPAFDPENPVYYEWDEDSQTWIEIVVAP